jgi:Pyruvate/2-oxoacid:ferredoxin oxidoreductase gamma subunit
MVLSLRLLPETSVRSTSALKFLPLKESIIIDAIMSTVPKKVLEINQKAFAAGKAQVS